MTINFGAEPADWGFVGFPIEMEQTSCPITNKVGCCDRKCELHYMDAPVVVARLCGVSNNTGVGTNHTCICIRPSGHDGSHRCGNCGTSW